MIFGKTNGQWKHYYSGELIKSAPLQVHSWDKDVPLLVSEEAYKEYAAQYGTSQSHARLMERGGFAASEIATLLYERIKRLEVEHAKR